MAVQKHHNVANSFLFGPARRDLPSAELADARHFSKSARVGLNDFEGVESELADDPLCELRPDASDHARAQIASHAFLGRRWRALQQVGLELQAMRSIRQPNPDRVDVLTGGDRSGMPNDGDQVPPASRLHLEDSKAGIRIMESHPLDATDQCLAFRSKLHSRGGTNGHLPSSPFQLRPSMPNLAPRVVGLPSPPTSAFGVFTVAGLRVPSSCLRNSKVFGASGVILGYVNYCALHNFRLLFLCSAPK